MKQLVKILAVFLITILTVTLADAKVDMPRVAAPAQPFVIGRASWYSETDPGINPRTANNEIFNDKGLTCAMWGVPFNQRIRVTNLANGKSVVVRVNDRGPHKRYVRKGRVIDLTKAAFSRIDNTHSGLIDVALELL
jgi:rare lipoprotein A